MAVNSEAEIVETTTTESPSTTANPDLVQVFVSSNTTVDLIVAYTEDFEDNSSDYYNEYKDIIMSKLYSVYFFAGFNFGLSLDSFSVTFVEGEMIRTAYAVAFINAGFNKDISTDAHFDEKQLKMEFSNALMLAIEDKIANEKNEPDNIFSRVASVQVNVGVNSPYDYIHTATCSKYAKEVDFDTTEDQLTLTGDSNNNNNNNNNHNHNNYNNNNNYINNIQSSSF